MRIKYNWKVNINIKEMKVHLQVLHLKHQKKINVKEKIEDLIQKIKNIAIKNISITSINITSIHFPKIEGDKALNACKDYVKKWLINLEGIKINIKTLFLKD